mgnify:FL=1
MERANGFSWLQREKGVFQDSLTNSKIYVFVDDLRQPKIRLLYNDSLTMFLNFNDSLVTQSVFKDLSEEVLSDLKLGD